MLKIFERMLWSDRRVRLVVGAVAVTILATFLFWAFVDAATKPDHFLGAFFASWISGLLLFLFVGLAVAIVSLARPDQELFDARARNLLRRQEGSHIDYIVGKFHDLLEAYVATSVKHIDVLDYHDGEQKLYTSQTTRNCLQGYLDDKSVTMKSPVVYKDGTLPPPGKPGASLTYIKINGELLGEQQNFDTEFRRDLNATIHPKKPLVVEHRMLYWIKAGVEPNRHLPMRYTKSMVVTVENHLPSMQVVVTSRKKDGSEATYAIPPGATETIVDISESAPPEELYNFTIGVA